MSRGAVSYTSRLRDNGLNWTGGGGGDRRRGKSKSQLIYVIKVVWTNFIEIVYTCQK